MYVKMHANDAEAALFYRCFFCVVRGGVRVFNCSTVIRGPDALDSVVAFVFLTSRSLMWKQLFGGSGSTAKSKESSPPEPPKADRGVCPWKDCSCGAGCKCGSNCSCGSVRK